MIEQSHGYHAKKMLKSYHNQNNSILKTKNGIQFMIQCRNNKLIPGFIQKRTNRLVKTMGFENLKLKKFVTQTNKKLLNLTIGHYFKELNKQEHKLKNIIYKIKNNIPHPTIKTFLHTQRQSTKLMKENLKTKTNEKFSEIWKNEDIEIKPADGWFMNLSNQPIPENIKNTLALGPKFAIGYTKDNFPLYNTISETENLVKNIENLSENSQSEIRSKMASIITSHLNTIQKHITPSQNYIQNQYKKTQLFLKQNPNILIIEADKGSTSIAVNKIEYTKNIETILTNNSRYIKLAIDPTTILQRRNNNLIKTMFDKKYIDENQRKKLSTFIAQTPRCYGVMKIHKPNKPYRLIISNIGNPAYALGQFLNEICKPAIANSKLNIKNSFELKTKLLQIQINQDEIIASFDVVSMFEMIPKNLVYKSIEKRWHLISQHTTINKTMFIDLIKFCVEDTSYFSFNNRSYRQRTGLAIGGCVSTILADYVLTDIIEEAMKKLSYDPTLIVKYVDDILIITPKKELQNTFTIFNSINPNIQFTQEIENDGKLAYLDITIIRDNSPDIKTEFYQKPTHKGRMINFHSSHPIHQKINTAYGLISRILTLTSEHLWNKNIQTAKNLLTMNGYPTEVINSLIHQFMSTNTSKINSKIPNKNTNTQSDPVKYISYNYISGLSENIQKFIHKHDSSIKLGHKSKRTIKEILPITKQKIPPDKKSGLIYQINCNNCNGVYIGQTKQHLKSRINQHIYDSKNKHVITQGITAAVSHSISTSHTFNFKKPIILATEKNYTKRSTLEMLYIKSNSDAVNKKTDTDSLHPVYASLINIAKNKHSRKNNQNNLPSLSNQI